VNGVVLYIDDNQGNILLVQRLLERARPDVRLSTASTGRDGVRDAIDSQPALILLDNRLPDTNGEQVLRELAANPATAAIPVVILSGDTGREVIGELLTAGAAEFVAKPFNIHGLLATIERYLAKPPTAPRG
jgi:CheY-like chemotaxis protein